MIDVLQYESISNKKNPCTYTNISDMDVSLNVLFNNVSFILTIFKKSDGDIAIASVRLSVHFSSVRHAISS